MAGSGTAGACVGGACGGEGPQPRWKKLQTRLSVHRLAGWQAFRQHSEELGSTSLPAAVPSPSSSCYTFSRVVSRRGLQQGGIPLFSPLCPSCTSALHLLVSPCLAAPTSACLQEVQAPPKPKLTVEQQVAEAEVAHKKDEAATAVRRQHMLHASAGRQRRLLHAIESRACFMPMKAAAPAICL